MFPSGFWSGCGDYMALSLVRLLEMATASKGGGRS